MPYVIYQRTGQIAPHIRDDLGNHWTIRTGRGNDVRDLSDGSPIDPRVEILQRDPLIYAKNEHRSRGTSRAYSRIAGTSQVYAYLPSFRGITHGVMNAVTQEGSWAWYTGYGGRKQYAGNVQNGYVPRRQQGTAMAAATLAEIGKACSATEYARAGKGAWWTRGHASIPYEWCHLVAHGMSGPDIPANLVAATSFQNTEQFIIECVLYGYRMEGFSVEVHAKLAKGTAHLAESIWYKILLGAEVVWTRTMDARRATRPDWNEYRTIARSIRTALNAALERRYEGNYEPTYEVLEYIETELVKISADDGSNSFWR